MCYSVQSSIVAWLVSVGIGMYLWSRNNRYDRWNASFIWTFSAVQLWEAGIWGSSSPQTQGFFVALIMLTLLAQPLVQTFGAWKSTGSDVLKYMTFVYGAIWLYTLYRAFTEKFSVSRGPTGHLVWHTNNDSVVGGSFSFIGLLYILGLFLGLLWGLPQTVLLIAVGFATLWWSYTNVSTGEFSSYWCYTAMAYSVAALFTGS